MPNTTRDVITKPTLPVLGAAPYFFNDGAFDTPIVRVTDGNTGFAFTAEVNHSWSPPSAVSQRAWASDSTHFYGIHRNGGVLVFNFNTSTRVPTEREMLVNTSGEPSFSRTNPNYLYSAGGNSHKLLKRIDLSTTPGTYTTVFDTEVLIPALSVGDTYMRGGFTCDNDSIVCNAGGSSQDLTQYVIVWLFSNPAGVKILNSRTRTEMFKSYGVGPYLHAVQPDTSGRYVLLRVASGQAPGGGDRSDWAYVWDIQTDSITEITASADSHYSLGNGLMVNQTIISGHTYDDRQWVLRSLATPNSGLSELVSPVCSPISSFSEDHTSFIVSGTSNQFAPVVSITYRNWDGPHAVQNAPISYANTEVWGPLDEEIIKLSTDGSGIIYRFAHHRTRTWREPEAGWLLGNEFYATPLFSASMDGRFVLFNSNWEHTLGLSAHDYDPVIHRTDMFVAEFNPSPQISTPRLRRRK